MKAMSRLLVAAVVGATLLVPHAVSARRLVGGKTEKREIRLAESSLKRARSLHEKGQMQAAIEEYRNAIEFRPEMAISYFELARLYYDIGIFPLAAQYLESGIELGIAYKEFDDEFIVSQYGLLALCYDKTNQHDKASSALTKGASIMPSNPGLRVVLAEIYANNNRIDSAIKAYNDALKLAPGDLNVLNALGDLALEHAKPETAREVLEAKSKLDPDAASSFQSRMAAQGLR